MTEPTTWLEVAFMRSGPRVSIVFDRTPNQMALEYKAIDGPSQRPDHLYSYTSHDRDLTARHAWRVDTLTGAHIVDRLRGDRCAILHVPTTQSELTIPIFGWPAHEGSTRLNTFRRALATAQALHESQS